MATKDRERIDLDRMLAETAASRADVKKLLAEAALYEQQTKAELRRERAEDARVMLFNTEVTEFEVGEACERLHDWNLEGNAPITVILNSPGGEVFSGLLLFDSLRASPAHVTTIVRGLGASMGSILSQAGDTRLVSPNSWFMIHEPSTLAWGKAGDIKREAKVLEQMHDQMCGIFAERATLSKAEIKRRSQDKDWWMTAQEALNYKFFDGESS